MPRRGGCSPAIIVKCIYARRKKHEMRRVIVPASPRSSIALSLPFALALGLVVASALVACNGCRSSQTPTVTSASAEAGAADPGPPTLRLYLLTDVAGVFEPCGCTKDQLGGVDHVAAWIQSEKAKAPQSALVAAGPLFFMEAALTPERAEQDQTKAETIARAMKVLGLVAFAPGDNDWAAGQSRLGELAQASGGVALYGGSGANGVTVRVIHGVKVGFIGVGATASAAPVGDGGARAVATVERPKAADAVRAGIEAAKKEGAKVLIVLAAVGRGEAKRIADNAPELTAIIVGSQSQSGEANTVAPPAERIGNVIIAEAANHMQSVAVLDLFVRGDSFSFADASGLEQARKREELTRRLDDLRIKIANWDRDGKVSRADLDARRADMTRLERERDALDTRPAPTTGSFFRYAVKEIRVALGKDDAVGAEMLAYYKKVNDRNKILFADRAPRPHVGDQATYIGVGACATVCHADAKKFWETTTHAHAYETLSSQFKEFNLDCVSCHVTGYEVPGGSTVTHVDKLKDVQCEVCHGPGSKHALNPTDKKLIVSRPKADLCLSCHHPPHVEQFDAQQKMTEILGPGHGRSK